MFTVINAQLVWLKNRNLIIENHTKQSTPLQQSHPYQTNPCDVSAHQKRKTWLLYSHMKEEMKSWSDLEGSIGGHCCWFDAQADFKSSKSSLEILDVFCVWFDAQAAMRSSRCFLEIPVALFCCSFDPRSFFTSLMRFTASFNVEDSHDNAFLCWSFDAKTAFKSSKSFLETHDSFFCCWFDPRRLFTSFKSSFMTSIASSKEEDSSDVWHDTNSGTALTSNDKDVISTQITKIKRKAEKRASDMLTDCNYIAGWTELQ